MARRLLYINSVRLLAAALLGLLFAVVAKGAFVVGGVPVTFGQTWAFSFLVGWAYILYRKDHID